MAATPLATPTQRATGLGHLKVYFVPTIADKTSPTRSELTAGTDWSNEIFAINGFSTEATTVDAPDLGTSFVSQTSSYTTAADSSLDIYISTGTVPAGDARKVFTRGTTGFIVIFDDQDIPTHLMDVWPVAVRAQSKARAADGNLAVNVAFRITSLPAENVVVPA